MFSLSPACIGLKLRLCHECGLASQIIRKDIFKIMPIHAIPIVQLILRVLSMPIPLYSMWQVYQTCSLLKLLRAPACCKKKEEKSMFLYCTCMFVFILTVSVSPTPIYIQTKTNVSQNFPFLIQRFSIALTVSYGIIPDDSADHKYRWEVFFYWVFLIRFLGNTRWYWPHYHICQRKVNHDNCPWFHSSTCKA